MRKVGPTFHKRVFAEKPVSKLTVALRLNVGDDLLVLVFAR
jgi:hypothetical protein